tara:strand:- start:162 stop:602 length:441 start_codon:yes stop_codon:yes gene_type:complete
MKSMNDNYGLSVSLVDAVNKVVNGEPKEVEETEEEKIEENLSEAKVNPKDPADSMTLSMLSDAYKDAFGIRPRDESFWGKNISYGQVQRTFDRLSKIIADEIKFYKDERIRRKLDDIKEKKVQAQRHFGSIKPGEQMKAAFKKAGK